MPISIFSIRKITLFILVLALLTLAAIWIRARYESAVYSPPPTKEQNKTIGISTFVDHVVLNTVRDGFMSELIAGGYIKENGWNVTILNANGNPAEAAAIADELLNIKPTVLVSFTTPATKPLFEKNNGRYPLIFSFVSFPESIGITDQSPNVTGLSDGVDFNLLLSLIQDTLPKIKRIGMVYSDEPNAQVSYDRMRALAETARFQFSSQTVSKEEEVRGAVDALIQQPRKRRPQAIVVGADGVVTNKIVALLDAANAAKIPVFAVDEASVEKGALAGLSVNYSDFGKETARVTMRVLKGEKPETIPMNRFLAKEILVNKITAKKIGVDIPSKVIERAIRVIE
ncbi:ABC transporter substrate-binding protein [Methyloglobulus sp.]|uniref:ABC transporter substrate-binding protein n=1 Tax=Methyloglobulus sp. TaxID=2518622 RepID=UPI003988DC89